MVEKETMEEILKVLTKVKEEKNLNGEIPFNSDNFDVEESEILVPIVISSSEFKNKKLKKSNVILVFKLYSIPTYGYIVRFESVRYKRRYRTYEFKCVYNEQFQLVRIKDESHMIVSTRWDDITNGNIMKDTIYRILVKFFTYNNRYGERKPFVRQFFVTTKRGNRSLKLKLLIYDFKVDNDPTNGSLIVINKDSSLI